MSDTKIEWTDKSWNPVTGCTPCSVGCQNCYAKRMARRLAGRCGYPAAPNEFAVTFHPGRLDEPLKWRKPRKIFVCSMSDLFHPHVRFPWRHRILLTIDRCPQHTFMLLTKRPGNMRYIFSRSAIRPNLWLGASICHSEDLWEIPHLIATPAARRFVSFEPLLGPIHISDRLHSLDWVIVGAETGPGKRPMQLDWARSIRDQCQAAGVPFFFKRDSDGKNTLDGVEHHNWPETRGEAP